MRKLLTAALAVISALAFFVVGSTPAHAFGSEVLGCQIGQAGLPPSSWSANSCSYGETWDDYYWITYSPANLSGTYSYAWTLTLPSGYTVTTPCSATTGPCIDSGCTTTSSSCVLRIPNPPSNRTYTATLQLTQSGLSRTIQAQAYVTGNPPWA